ncbi:MAG: hypothetical protein JJT88_20610 [Gammaproteobacteria bacterium]|nr:hypothetical protein [Gammaproteobacteria bacterium]
MSRFNVLIIPLFAWSLAGHADVPRVDHYEGMAAESLEEAFAHLAEYNERLAAIVDGDVLTPTDLNAIHQLTYTLENALERIRTEVVSIAETLEEVHLASEGADGDRTLAQARAYLEASNQLIRME